ncbi:MAG: sugar kinase [Myxococcota bacterium]|nr:sugar kinase [Myxococcota bacterium]
MPASDLVSVGLTVLDLLGRAVDAIPESGGVALIDEIRLTPAGTAVAPAMAAARMGLRTRLVGAIGDDEIGAVLRAGLEQRGVDTSLLQEVAGVRTSATILPIRANGDRPALHAPGASLALRLAGDEQALLDTRFLHLGGVGTMPHVDGAPTERLLSTCRERGITTSCDLIAPSDATRAALDAALPHLDYFMPTLEEALTLSGTANARAAADTFLARGAGTCVFKCGAEGSLVATRDELTRVPAFEVDVVDTSGCGDSYCGGFLTALSHGFELAEACRFASATAALVATGLGSDAGITSFDDTLAAMKSLPVRA